MQTSVPAKSSQSGVMLIVVPGVLGLMCWSPGLDCNGNSWRGVHFCEVWKWISILQYEIKIGVLWLLVHVP